MKLELKHVQFYPIGKDGIKILLPKHQFKYGEQSSLPLNGVSVGTENELQLEMLLPDNDLCFTYEIDINKCKLILHPLSDLTKEIEINGKKFIPEDKFDHVISFYSDSVILEMRGYERINLLDHPMKIINQLFEWHFDVFGLIEKGFAIDINTL